MRMLPLLLLFVASAPAQTPHSTTRVWGRIIAVAEGKIEIEQNFNADPHSAYRRGKRQMKFNSKTKFEESARQDLRIGRTVDIFGRETTDLSVRATRIIVDDGNTPVRMPAGTRVMAPDGSVHTLR
jgi:hypothetical protein